MGKNEPELHVGGPRVVGGHHRQKSLRRARTEGNGKSLDVVIGLQILHNNRRRGGRNRHRNRGRRTGDWDGRRRNSWKAQSFFNRQLEKEEKI